MTTIQASTPRDHLAIQEFESPARTCTPVKWYAGVGVAALLLQVYLYSRWILSGNAVRTDPGPDPIPGWMEAAAHVHEAISVTLLCVCAYFFVIRPLRREGKLGLNGLMFFAALTCYWQDLASNYFNHVYTFNAALHNFGSWFNFIPGWRSPNAEHLVEPILFEGPVYVWVCISLGIAAAALMRKAKARWPRMGIVGLLGIALLAMGAFDVILEVFWVRLGLYSFAGVIPSFTLFAGEYYQFPLYEPVILGGVFVGFASVFYFRDDKGYSFVERGVDSLRIGPRMKAWTRFLGLAGFLNLLFFSYNLIFAFISMLPGFTWSSDIVGRRSYLRNQVCGAGTDYACPGTGLPVPTDGGVHISPDGKLVVPPG